MFLRITIALAVFAVCLFLLVDFLTSKSTPSTAEVLSSLSLRQKVAQMFMFYYPGTSFSKAQLERIEQLPPGGMIVMGDNITSRSQLASFTQQFSLAAGKSAFGKHSSWLKPLIAVDQEGGLVKRLKWDSTLSAAELATISDGEVCEESQQRADVLTEAGINVNFAPVVDLQTAGEAFINNRTISTEPQVVIAKAGEFIKCSEQAGVSATIKHFPGHGATTEDSHYVLPHIDMSKQEWRSSHGRVFAELIERSSPDLLMVGHLQFDQIDQQPSTLSRELLTGVLREELGFKGVSISDDMAQLHAATEITHREAITRAINAGIDIILYINTGPYKHNQLIDMTVEQVESGEISEKQIDEALTRIIELKLRL